MSISNSLSAFMMASLADIFFNSLMAGPFLMNVEWNLHSREGAYAASYAGVGIYSVGRGATDA
jgi:hypothetical protein